MKKGKKDIVRKHIRELFLEAEKKPDMGSRYVKIARKIAMKFRIPLPSHLKRKFCPHCYKYYIYGKTLRVRIHGNKIVYSCLHCGKYWRRPLK